MHEVSMAAPRAAQVTRAWLVRNTTETPVERRLLR
jgi:hypothetical protein